MNPQVEQFDQHVAQYEQWYMDHPEVYQSEILALQEQFLELPQNIRGIEVGVGTGKFSKPLGIKEGVEPSRKMAEKAMKRGVEIIEATAERLPYAALQFDFVLFVTICHLKDLQKALEEAHRVLKPKGALIMGFLDRDQKIAQEYLAKRHKSNFYGKATFYTVDRVLRLLRATGFSDPHFNQTLFGDLQSIKELQLPLEGYGKGSFVTVKTVKR